nr:hypothetical protein [Tanacetum cinerariifolium]
MANVPPNDPNVDAPAIAPALVNPDHAPAQPIVPTGPMCPNLGTAWKRLRKMEKLMSKRIDTEGRIKKNFKEQDRHFLDLGCDNIKTDRTVRNVMSDLSEVKKLVKGLSDRFDEYKRSKVFDAKRVLEKELVNERNAKEFYREFGKYMCRMLQNRQKSKGSFPLPLSLDAAIADAAIATSSIDDDDDDTAPMDSHPHEPRGSPHDPQTILPRKSTRGNPPPSLTQDTMNGPNVAPVARECTFADFMKCSPITFCGNEGAAGLIRWIEKTKMVFTVATSRIEVMTRKTWAEMKVMMTKEFCPPEEIQRMEATLGKAVRMAHTLMEQKVKAKAEREANNKKRKWENFQGGSSSGGGNNNSNRNNNNNYNNNCNYNNNRNNNQNQYRNPNRNHQNNQRQGNARAMTNVGNQNTNDAGQNVKCNRYCWSKVVATGANAQPVVTCYGCGEKGHIKTNCPARNNPGRNEARGQAYALRDGDQNLGPNVVT